MAIPHPNQTLFLLDLPTEILMQITQELGQNTTIPTSSMKNFRRTCKQSLDLCEPTFCSRFCITTPLRSQRVNLLLSICKHRHSYVKTVQIKALSDNKTNFRTMTLCISDLVNLKDLSVFVSSRPSSTHLLATIQSLRSALVSQLGSCAFAELRNCQITYRRTAYEQNPFQLESLLKAPKLSSLRITGTDLRGFRSARPQQKSSFLQELILRDCPMDEQATVTLLRWPSALKHMEFEATPGAGTEIQ